MSRRASISWTNSIGQVGSIELDASVEETHTLASQVTDHPVETGPNVSDFIRPEPLQLAIRGVITNTPILLPADHTDGARIIAVSVDGAPQTLGGTIGRPVPIAGALLAQTPVNLPRQKAGTIGFDPDFDRVGAVYAEFQEIWQRGYLLQVFTTLATYENLAVVSFSVERSAASGSALMLQLQLKQVRLAKVETAEVPAIPTTQKKNGSKPTKTPDAPAEVEEESFAHEMKGVLFGS